jgi:hypothetical protein
MKLTIAASALSAVVLLGGCGGKGSADAGATKKVQTASVNAGEEATLFPLKVGNQWVYTVESNIVQQGKEINRKAEVMFVVTDVSPTADGAKATFEVRQKNNVVDKQIWEVNKRGIFQLTSGKTQVGFNPPVPGILFPLGEKNSKFEWAGSGIQPIGGVGTGVLHNVYLGAQNVDTDMGQMSAYCVESQGTFKVKGGSGAQKSSTWWAPKVGMVRFHSQAVVRGLTTIQILRLKGFTPK